MLAVSNLKHSIQFYQDKLGFKVNLQWDGYAVLELENMWLHLTTESPPTSDKPDVTLVPNHSASTSSVNLIFYVDDCHKAYQALSEKGVAFLTAPQQPTWGGWRCFAQDPDGYLLEIVTE